MITARKVLSDTCRSNTCNAFLPFVGYTFHQSDLYTSSFHGWSSTTFPLNIPRHHLRHPQPVDKESQALSPFKRTDRCQQIFQSKDDSMPSYTSRDAAKAVSEAYDRHSHFIDLYRGTELDYTRQPQQSSGRQDPALASARSSFSTASESPEQPLTAFNQANNGSQAGSSRLSMVTIVGYPALWLAFANPRRHGVPGPP
jgi:hypothetical protein